MEGSKNATIVDVAKKASVSVATVSRVLNGNYSVREATKKRVEEAIAVLAYVPNLQARELNMQKSSTIGVVVPDLFNTFFSLVMDGIEERLREDGYSLLLNFAKNDPHQEMACIEALVSRNVSGIIVISPNTTHIRESFYRKLSLRLPLVFINGYRSIPHISYVGNDERKGTHTALQYLMQLGHREILFVRGAASDSYRVKEESYRKHMAARGAEDAVCVIDIGEGNSRKTIDLAESKMVESLVTYKPTAVFCCNDLMAIGTLRAAKKVGLHVPRDLSVMGFDNILAARLVEPALTTMDQHMTLLGKHAAKALLAVIQSGKTQHILLDNTLVVRASTGPAPKRLV